MPLTAAEFREVVRKLIADGRYPDHRSLTFAMGRTIDRARSGLSAEQSAIRRAEIEAAGFDWEASKKTRALVRR